MPDASMEQVLVRATADVLEKMFFTGFAADLDGMPEAGAQIAVTLAFDGELRGRLTLAISAGAARTLAADFLGVDADDGAEPDAAQVNEVVCELANMICGDTLSAVEKGTLRLSVPAIVPACDFVPPASGCRRSFDLGSGWLTVALALEEGHA